MAKSLENIVEGTEVPEQDHDNLESKVQKDKGSILKFLGGAAVTAGVMVATHGIVGMNSVYTAIGNAIGYLIEIKRNKEKFKFSRFFKEAWTGAVMGVVGTGIYTAIDKVPVVKMVEPLKNVVPRYYEIVKKAAKTLAFNPGLLFPYLAFYKGFTYLRDNFGKMKNKKDGSMLKETYEKGVKKDFGKDMKKIFGLFPIHYVNVNYVTHVPTRIIIGVINDILFRFFQRKKVEPVENKNTLRDKYDTLKNKYQNLKDRYNTNYGTPALAGSY